MFCMERMPLTSSNQFDYNSYLCSSSPPIYDFLTSRNNDFFTATNLENRRLQRINDLHRSNNINRCKSDTSLSSKTTLNPTKSGLKSPNSPRSSKSVCFADQLGFALVSIKILSNQPPNVPIYYTDDYYDYSQLKLSNIEKPKFKVNFSQPGAQYVTFHERLEKECVSLENIIMKKYSIIGTLKVKNISFEKHVFVRLSTNDWKSFDDHLCNYTSSHDKYDTFSFEIKLPENCRIASFSICYKTNGNEFWDNNSKKNYTILSTDDDDYKDQLSEFNHLNFKNDNWSEYAAWKDQKLTLPYW